MALSALSGCTLTCMASWSTENTNPGLEFTYNQCGTKKVQMVRVPVISRKEPKDKYFILSWREKSKYSLLLVLELVRKLDSEVIVSSFFLRILYVFWCTFCVLHFII